MHKSIKAISLLGIVVFLFVALNIDRLFALLWKADNVIVTFNDCESDCEIKGTLAISPLDGSLYIDNADGRTYLEEGSYREIYYPNPRSATKEN